LPCRAALAPHAVRSYRTISPLPLRARKRAAKVGGIFLLHFPSACAAQALPGTLPCGARTFLGVPTHDATARPTPQGHCTLDTMRVSLVVSVYWLTAPRRCVRHHLLAGEPRLRYLGTRFANTGISAYALRLHPRQPGEARPGGPECRLAVFAVARVCVARWAICSAADQQAGRKPPCLRKLSRVSQPLRSARRRTTSPHRNCCRRRYGRSPENRWSP